MAKTSSNQMAVVSGLVQQAEPKFIQIAHKSGDLVDWRTESNFAMQIMRGNDYLAGMPQETIIDAITNVAAIGLTLNPAEALTYLVPRDGKCCLDISYKGLYKLATDSGVLKTLTVEMVREADAFEWIDGFTYPKHAVADPWDDSVDSIKGGYVVAILQDGSVMATRMGVDELYRIRDKSEYYKRKKAGPWVDHTIQMMKKTLVKRAAKLWPRSSGSPRLDTAIDVLNQHEGITHDITDDVVEVIGEEQLNNITDLVLRARVAPDKILSAFEIESLSDLAKTDYDECVARLNDAITIQSKPEVAAVEAEQEEPPAEIPPGMCTLCGVNPVEVEQGVDTCDSCLAKQ